MSKDSSSSQQGLWAHHHAQWRDTAQIASQWEEAGAVDPRLLQTSVRGRFWDTLAALRVTLLMTREYEHLLIALTVAQGRPQMSYMSLPHPSGLAFDRAQGRVHVASTRNPNQIYALAPVSEQEPRRDVADVVDRTDRPLVPISASYHPGCSYIHDLAVIGGRVFANTVGQNAVARLENDGRLNRVWWPRCIETADGPVFDRNHLQLNSIAAGKSLSKSFFTASTDRVTARRPGHQNFQVDGAGVVFSGASRESVVTGLTRPHSARLHRRKLWLANSGYGEFGTIRRGRFEAVNRLPGWTRGVALNGGIAFVGTSRIIPRFEHYAPGISPDRAQCGVHAIDIRTGEVLGTLRWPYGNQLFAIEIVPRAFTRGFAFSASSSGRSKRAKRLFYTFKINNGRPTK